MNQNEFETVDEAFDEILRLRRIRDVLQKEMVETLCMVRTGATLEQVDYRLRNALAVTGSALIPER